MNLKDAPVLQQDREFVDAYLHAVGKRYVYGRSKEADSIALNTEVDYFIDDFTTESHHLGKPVVRLSDVPSDAFVVSAVVQAFAVTVMRKLAEKKLRSMDYFLFKKVSGLPLRNIPYWEGAVEHFESHKDDYIRLFSALGDDESRDVFNRLLSFRLYQNMSVMNVFTTNLQGMYFERFLNFDPLDAIFFDVGAFDGFNSECFEKLYPNMKASILFEPIQKQAAMLRAKFDSNSRFHVFEYALSNREGFVRFSENDTQSKIIDNQNEGVLVPTIKLDDFSNQQSLIPSFIKMDIEGAELMALSGAENVIRKFKPNLAISVYHQASHLTEVYEYLSKLYSGYKFYLRHYTEGYTETVLFAVPEH